MASRKSSILKPRKTREPLQDLNQLLPNNDEETTTTEVQKRRVSFASINKVKEFESAAECLTILNTPAYDERFSLSSDSCQSSLLCQSQSEFIQNSVASSCRKSISNAKPIIDKDENVYVEEDIELTETVGRIYDTSLKNGQIDSSMELTDGIPFDGGTFHLVNQKTIEEVICPLKLTENYVQKNIVYTAGEIDSMIQLNRSNDSSSMETTEVLTNNLLTEAVISQQFQPLEVENTCAEFDTQFEDRTMNMSTYEILPPRKSIFHPVTDQLPRKSIFEINAAKSERNTEHIKHIECQSNFETVSMEMSALEVSLSPREIERSQSKLLNDSTNKKTHNLSMPVFSQNSRDVPEYHNTSMQLFSQNENKTRYNNSSMQLLSQNIDVKVESNTSIRMSSGNIADKTKPHNSSLQLLSKNIEYSKTNYNTSVQVSNPNVEEKTNYHNSSLCLLSRNNENDTKYPNSEMQFSSQNMESEFINSNPNSQKSCQYAENKTNYLNSSMVIVSQQTENFPVSQNDKLVSQNDKLVSQNDENKTNYNISSMQLLSQSIENKIYDRESSIHLLIDNADEKNQEYDFNTLGVSQIFSDKTKYNNSSMQMLSQSVVEKTKYGNSSMHLTEVLSKEDPLQSIAVPIEAPIMSSHIEDNQNTQATNISNNPVVSGSDSADVRETKEDDVNEGLLEMSHKSSSDDTSSANDSNSPLTVGVNFSIFQKNKETRVEFSGTIDSNKKQKSRSISNVQVNIVNNKIAKQNKNVRQLRFSMPACKTTCENTNANVFASFMDVNVPSENTDDVKTESKENQLKSIIYEQKSSLITPAVNDDCKQMEGELMNSQITKPRKKRSSSEILGEVESNAAKRSCVEEIVGNVNQPTTETLNEVDNSKCEHFCTEKVSQTTEHISLEKLNEAKTVTENVEFANRTHVTMVGETEDNMAKRDPTSPKEVGEMDNTAKRSCLENIAEIANKVSLVNVDIADEQPHSAPIALLSEKSDESSAVESLKFGEDVLKLLPSPEIDLKIKECSPEFATDQSSFITTQSTPYRQRRRTRLDSESAPEYDFIDDNPLNNPSIIVNIGDSFSHRKSFELNAENFSSADVCDSTKDELETRNLISTIASDKFSKENFVSYWLHNKTGNTENKNVEKNSSVYSAAPQTFLPGQEKKKINSESRLKLTGEKFDEKQDSEEVESRSESSANNEKKLNSNTSKLDECDSEVTEPSRKTEVFEKHDQKKMDVSDFKDGDAKLSNDKIFYQEIQQMKICNAESFIKLADKRTESSNAKVIHEDELKGIELFHRVEEIAATKQTEYSQNEITSGSSLNCESMTKSSCEFEKLQKKVDSITELDSDVVKESNSNQIFGNCQLQVNKSISKLEVPEKLAENVSKIEVYSESVTEKTKESNNNQVVNQSELIVSESGNEIEHFQKTDLTSTKINVFLPKNKPPLISLENFEESHNDFHDNDALISDEERVKPTLNPIEYSDCTEKAEFMNIEDNLSKNHKEMSLNLTASLRCNQVNKNECRTSPEKVLDESKAVDQEMRDLTGTLAAKKMILEKILDEISYCKPEWVLLVTTENVWTFQFLDKRLELMINFLPGKDSCTAELKFVQPTSGDCHEILKIAIDSCIRKCAPKIKTYCLCANDVPHVLNLIKPDIIFTKRFIDDIIELGESDEVKILNGRASFYVVSYKNMLYIKILVRIKNLDHLSINDIEIEEKIGKVDSSLVHRLFLESGRNYNFFSTFVQKLWRTLV